MLGFVLPDGLHLFFRPYTNSHSAEGSDRGCFYFSFSNPTVQRVRSNAEKSGNLERRVGRHIISGTLPVIVKGEIRATNRGLNLAARSHEGSIAPFAMIG
jgi:hypothetical protein